MAALGSGHVGASSLTAHRAAVDRLAPTTVAAGEVATLKHKAGDDAVELRTLVVERFPTQANTLVTRAECPELRVRSEPAQLVIK